MICPFHHTVDTVSHNLFRPTGGRAKKVGLEAFIQRLSFLKLPLPHFPALPRSGSGTLSLVWRAEVGGSAEKKGVHEGDCRLCQQLPSLLGF